MQAYEGYFEQGGQFVPRGMASIPMRKRAIVTILDEQPTHDEAFTEPKKQPVFGSGKGKMWISGDFDIPLEELREYME